MKRFLLCGLLLAACTGQSVPVYVQPGVSARQALEAEAICKEQARRSVPVRTGIAVSPSIGIGIGDDNRTRAGVVFGSGYREVYDYDRNAGLRGEAVGVCMGGLGYRLISLPACTGPATVLVSHPFDYTGTCVSNGAVAVPRG